MSNIVRDYLDRTRETRRAAHEQRLARLASPAKRTWKADAVECPHCGDVRHDDLYDYEDGDEYTCGRCEGTASLEIETSRIFTARPKASPPSLPEFDE